MSDRLSEGFYRDFGLARIIDFVHPSSPCEIRELSMKIVEELC